jgi:hypothetical protein
MDNTEKTIPYRLSPAELASFRIMRKKIKTFDSKQDDEEEKIPGETDIWNSELDPKNQSDEEDTP